MKGNNSILKTLRQNVIWLLDFFRYRKSYSQDGEDVVLASFFEGRKKYKGFYIDVGAHHPVRFSNTLYFYKRGWSGINIDPTPGSMRLFQVLRRRDINLEIAIGAESGRLPFYCFNEPALNTFDTEIAKARNNHNPYYIKEIEEVPIEPLSLILDKHLSVGQLIDFISIDVEGLDMVVLLSNNWTKYSPKYILVEEVGFSIKNPNESKIFNFLTSKGYDIISVLNRTIIYKYISDAYA